MTTLFYLVAGSPVFAGYLAAPIVCVFEGADDYWEAMDQQAMLDDYWEAMDQQAMLDDEQPDYWDDAYYCKDPEPSTEEGFHASVLRVMERHTCDRTAAEHYVALLEDGYSAYQARVWSGLGDPES